MATCNGLYSARNLWLMWMARGIWEIYSRLQANKKCQDHACVQLDLRIIMLPWTCGFSHASLKWLACHLWRERFFRGHSLRGSISRLALKRRGESSKCKF